MSSINGVTTVWILLVDDDALVRAGLRMMLGGAADLDVVGEAGDGAEGARPRLDLAPRRGADGHQDAAPRRVVGGRGTDGAAEPAEGDHADDLRHRRAVVAALRLGASGFLLKDTPPDRIVDAVRRVAESPPVSRCSPPLWSPD